MEREYAHKLLDQLDAGQFEAVGRLIEVMVDPAARELAAAPIDDEPVTEEDIRRFKHGEVWFAEHGGIPMEEVLAEFGFTMDDFPLPADDPVSATV